MVWVLGLVSMWRELDELKLHALMLAVAFGRGVGNRT